MPKQYRLSDKKIIQACAVKGTRNVSKYIIVKYLPASKPSFAILISKKYDKRAAERNKIRRQIRTILMENISIINPGYYMIIIKNDTGCLDFSLLYKDLVSNLVKFKQSGITK